MKRTVRSILLRIAASLPYNHRHGREHYPQLWALVPRWRLVKWVCKHLTGHEPSLTERGYAGGNMEDRWCRWCNQHMVLPVAESVEFDHPIAQQIADELGWQEHT